MTLCEGAIQEYKLHQILTKLRIVDQNTQVIAKLNHTSGEANNCMTTVVLLKHSITFDENVSSQHEYQRLFKKRNEWLNNNSNINKCTENYSNLQSAWLRLVATSMDNAMTE